MRYYPADTKRRVLYVSVEVLQTGKMQCLISYLLGAKYCIFPVLLYNLFYVMKLITETGHTIGALKFLVLYNRICVGSADSHSVDLRFFRN